MDFINQGNQIAHEMNIEKWARGCLQILHFYNLKQEFYDLASMILIYGSIEKPTKHSKNLLEITLLDKINLDIYMNLLDNVCIFLVKQNQDFKNLKKNELSYWSYRFLEFYFNHILFNCIFKCDGLCFANKPLKTRANFSMLLSNIISKINEKCKEDAKIFFSRQNLLLFEGLLEQSCSQLIEKSKLSMEKTSSEPFTDDLLENCRETSYFAKSFADLLTCQEGIIPEIETKSNLRESQRNQTLFKYVCDLLDILHKIKINKSVERNESINIICELIRIIGIFVFENEFNQRTIIDNNIVFLLSTNLQVDNTFQREWSIIALRHILCANDKK